MGTTCDSVLNGNSILEAALQYHNRGWSVIPISPRGKKPARNWREFQTRRPTVHEVRRTFESTEYNIAVILGPISGGLAVRDFDLDGSYERWAQSHPELAKLLPTAATGRQGGYHVFFQISPQVIAQIEEETGKELHGALPLGDGEFKAGKGSYVVLAPSTHANGTQYRWVVPLQDQVPELDPRDTGLIQDYSQVRAPDTKAPSCPYDTEDTEHPYPLESSESSESTGDREPKLVTLSGPLEKQVEDVATRTLPQNCGKKRHRAIFGLARALKAIPELAKESGKALKPIVRVWHRRARNHINDKDFETTWFDFMDAWDRAKYPEGQGPFAEAVREAEVSEPPNWAKDYERAEMRKLASLVRALGRLSGGKPFPLPCRMAGLAIGVDHRTAHKWLKGFELEGVLKCVFRGSKQSGKANEYLYLEA